MKNNLLTLSLAVGAILLTAESLRAEQSQCAERAVIVQRLAENYGESRQSIGLTGSGQVLEVFASSETGTWTITVSTAAGVACLVAAGEHFERLDEELTPAMLGDPA